MVTRTSEKIITYTTRIISIHKMPILSTMKAEHERNRRMITKSMNNMNESLKLLVQSTVVQSTGRTPQILKTRRCVSTKQRHYASRKRLPPPPVQLQPVFRIRSLVHLNRSRSEQRRISDCSRVRKRPVVDRHRRNSQTVQQLLSLGKERIESNDSSL